jgi:5-(carboxyamino)imidazole ribonucleotide synthase
MMYRQSQPSVPDSLTIPVQSPPESPPIDRIGVIGGGQLAWMMAAAVQKLGLSLKIQTPEARDPAVAIAQAHLIAPIQDSQATARLAESCDVITFENEFVDLAALQVLADRGVRFAPSLQALAPLLDKADQRQYLADRGLPVPGFRVLGEATWDGTVETLDHLNPFGYPVVLKARRLGYDGQGTYIVQSAADLAELLQTRGLEPFLLEAFVPFDRELAIMAARGMDGAIALYPVVETDQQDQVCRWVLAPAQIPEQTQAEIETIARRILEELDITGIIGIELFYCDDRAQGTVLINEIAPRTHNSGHYSLDASETSQFEQQLRAISGRPLGNSQLRPPGALMVNLLGFESATDDYHDRRQHLANLPNAHVHWYGKSESRPGRKLGHVTVCLMAEDADRRRADAMDILGQIDRIWAG